MPSEYQNFVSAHIRTAPGATQTERMQSVAAMWRNRNQQTGRGMTSMSGGRVPMGKKQIYQVADTESVHVKPVNNPVAQVGGKTRQTRAMAAPLQPASELPQTGGGFLGVPDDASPWEAFKYGASIPFKAAGKILPFLL